MKWACITGASSGLGFEFARQLQQRGYQLVLISSNQKKLEQAAGQLEARQSGKILWFVQDLSRPDAADQIFQKLTEEGIELSVLIQNAGIGTTAEFLEEELEDHRRMMAVNCQSLAELSWLAGNTMKSRQEGWILHVASTGVYQPGPYTALYYASKSFVYSFSRALRQELKESNVQVSTLCPGTLKTNFFVRNGIATPKFAMDPAAAARKGLDGLFAKKDVIIPGWYNRLFLLLPETLRMQLVKWQKKRMLEDAKKRKS